MIFDLFKHQYLIYKCSFYNVWYCIVHLLKINVFLQVKQNHDLKVAVSRNFEELQKILTFIMKRMIDTTAVDENGFTTPSQNSDCVNVTSLSSSTLSVTQSLILRVTSLSSTLTVISPSSLTSNVMPSSSSTQTVLLKSSFTPAVMPSSSSLQIWCHLQHLLTWWKVLI